MNPFWRMWLKLTGQKIPNPFEEIHQESVELARVARALRGRLESYQSANDPFVEMIQDVWNRHQLMLNGSGGSTARD